MSEESAPPPEGLVFSKTGLASWPENCGFCCFSEKPEGGATPPKGSSEEVKKWYAKTGYCRRGNPGPSDKPFKHPEWPVVHLEKDWCGSGTV